MTLQDLERYNCNLNIVIFIRKTSTLLTLDEFKKKYVNNNVESKNYKPLSSYYCYDICINGNDLQVSVFRRGKFIFL